MKWIINQKYFDKLQDPNRFPDAMLGGGRASGKPINWHSQFRVSTDATERVPPVSGRGFAIASVVSPVG